MTQQGTKLASVLAEESKTYEKMQFRLWERFQGGFVLIKGSELEGVYPNFEMALAKGREKFGADPFMVKEIFAPGMEPVHFITRDII